MKIFRVVYIDNYHNSVPETDWSVDRNYCENYIERQSNKENYVIETNNLINIK